MTINRVLRIGALVCLLLAVFGVSFLSLNMLALGLLFWLLSEF